MEKSINQKIILKDKKCLKKTKNPVDKMFLRYAIKLRKESEKEREVWRKTEREAWRLNDER